MSTTRLEKYDPFQNGAIRALPAGLQMTLSGFSGLMGLAGEEEFRVMDITEQLLRKREPWAEGQVVEQFVRREQVTRPEASVKELCREYALARAHSTSEDQAYDRYMVHMMFPADCRKVDTLSWGHYRVVWGVGLRPLALAIEWLDRAEKEAWSASRLRAEIKAEFAPPAAEDDEQGGMDDSTEALRRFDDYCAGRLGQIVLIPPDEARRTLASLRCAIEYIDALRAKAATPVKESINQPSERR